MAGGHPIAAEPGVAGEVAIFGTQLSACRRSARLTQQELADRPGLSIRTLSNLELGRTCGDIQVHRV
jgi:hypothetical protein